MAPEHPFDQALQHVLTVAGIVGLVAADRRWGISGLSYCLILAFMTLHVVGARYLYSFVPYDAWFETLLGLNLSRQLGWERNHFDRFVHFAYGVLIGAVAYWFSRRRLELSILWSAAFAVQFILASGALYELLEWGIAVVLAPESAERYNGQQGDVWDPQKDMLLAALGAVMSIPVVAISDGRKRDSAAAGFPGRRK